MQYNKSVTILTLAFLILNCNSITEPVPDNFTWIAKNSGLPDHTTVTAITNDSETNTLYIGTQNGVYKSVDSGEQWTESNAGLDTRDISCIATDKNDVNIVYVGSWGKGVYLSRSGAEKWQKIWPADQNPHINAIAVSSDNAVFVATEHGLFKSANFGETWHHIFEYGKIKTVAPLPGDPDILYIGVRWHGNFCSHDGGLSWAKINKGVFSDGQDVAAANRFVFDPGDPKHLYMCTGWVDLYHSLDSGANWQRIGQQLFDRSVLGLAVCSLNSKDMWAITEAQGVFKSRDAGLTWVAMNHGLESIKVKSIHVLAAEKAAVYIGTLGKGLFKYVGE